MHKKFLFSILFSLALFQAYAQKREFSVVNIGFYNLENLYDTIHQAGINDYEYLPASKKKYNSQVYTDKIEKLSSVISEIGKNVSADGVAILGVSEIENKNVLIDLCRSENLKNRDYQIVHYDSPDARGVDVGFLYNPKYFKVDTSAALYVDLPAAANGYKGKTRDVLWIKGKLLGEEYHIFVNHWPSRYGGSSASADRRAATALVCRTAIDAILKVNTKANILVMGDLNDNPTDPSVVKVLKTSSTPAGAIKGKLYNPWEDIYKKGTGTIAYQDAWALFDQIIVSENVTNKSSDKYYFYQTGIYKREEMIQNSGKYKGYPKRTFDFDRYVGGFSDHFPVYITLVKPIEQ